MRTKLNGERTTKDVSPVSAPLFPVVSYTCRGRKYLARGKTKGLLTSFDLKTRRTIRKSMRHDGNVSDGTVRARQIFWHSRLVSLHRDHGLWIRTVDRIQWKHVVAIVEKIRRGGHAAETRHAYFSHLAWGLMAFEKPHLVQRLDEYLVEVGRPAQRPESSTLEARCPHELDDGVAGSA